MVDTILSKVIGWIDTGINFIVTHQSLFVIGFVAAMLSKMLKINLKVGK